MVVIKSLHKYRSAWISRLSTHLAQGEGVRNAFQTYLEQFYDLLIQAVETGKAEWLTPVLDGWVEARTQTEIDNRENTLATILDDIEIQTFILAGEHMEPEEALAFFNSLLPVFKFAREYTSRKEIRLLIDHISFELERTRSTLERLDKTKSDFIAIAAHELKTPLTLIEGYSAMLQDQSSKNGLSDYRMQYVKGIEGGTKRLRAIIDDMVDISMIDNNLLSLTFQPVWIGRLLEMLENDLKTTIKERNQEFGIQPFEGIDRMMFADGERLYQALRNILLNAIKFTPDGGKISVYGRQLPGFIEIIISDTGIGIDSSDYEWIFEKFGRLGNVSLHSSSTTKFKGGGPGLGLPITKGIIEAHGGAIWVESDGYDEVKYPGTTFHVLLPLREESPDEKIARYFNIAQETSISETTHTVSGIQY